MIVTRVIAVLTVASLLIADLGVAAPVPRGERPTTPRPAAREVAGPAVPVTEASAFAGLPLAFEENRGQADPAVRFIARGPGYTALLTERGALLALRRGAPALPRHLREPWRGASAPAPHLVRMTLVGVAPSPEVAGTEPLPGKVNYLLGRDPTKWRTDIPTYARVEMRGVYPGIDVVYYGNPRQLEHDFVVAPGADPGRIRLAFEGIDRMWTDPRGDLVLATAAGELRLQKPVVYQTIAGARREIASGYRLVPGRPETAVATRVAAEVAIDVAAWDRRRPLVIDPVLAYATFLGGSFTETPNAVTIDAAGNAYVTGHTSSVDFPVVNAVQSTHPAPGLLTAFVSKLNATGTALLYSTYVGGSAQTSGLAIAVDAAGQAYVAGATQAGDFPTTAQAFQPGVTSVVQDAFVFKLSASGAALLYSTYLGGSGNDAASGIAINAAGNAVVVGSTLSSDFPVAAAAQGTLGGNFDGFVVKLLPDGSDVVFSTYLGGFDDDLAYAVTMDAAGNVYVAGSTRSSDFPSGANGPLAPVPFPDTAFVTKLTAAGAIVSSTFYGGSGFTVANTVVVDQSGNVYVAGSTASTDLFIFGGLQSTNGGIQDAWLAKFNPSGNLLYSTYLGGEGVEAAYTIALTPSGDVWIGGQTNSLFFPGFPPPQPGDPADFVGFLTRVSFTSGLLSSQRIGFAVTALRTTASGDLFVVGQTGSSAFDPQPTPGAFQTTSPGHVDGFVVRFRGLPDLAVAGLTAPPATTGPGRSFSVTVSTQNLGDAPAPASQTRLYLVAAGSSLRTLRAQIAVGALAAGARSTSTVTLTVPKPQPAGDYALMACADAAGQILEEHEGNNCVTSGAVHVGRADLVVTAVTLATAAVTSGARLGVTVGLRNQGDLASVASQTRFYLAAAATRAEFDVKLATLLGFAVLAPGQTATATVQLTIPAGQTPNTYFIIACADDRGATLESNETNNCLASLPLGVAAAAVATVASVSVMPSAVTIGGALAPTGVATGASIPVMTRAVTIGGALAPTAVWRLVIPTAPPDLGATATTPSGVWRWDVTEGWVFEPDPLEETLVPLEGVGSAEDGSTR